MDQGKAIPPPAPALALREARLDPLRKVGRAFQRLASKLPHSAVGKTFGQWIDRLSDRRRRPLPRFGDLWVDDLPLVPVSLELAGNDPLLAERKAAFRPSRIVEINEADGVPFGVGREHSRRTPSGAVVARLVGRQLQDHIAAKQGGAGAGRLDPFDRSGRQVIQHIDDAVEVEPLEEPGNLRSDPLEDLDLGEQGIEDFGAHFGLRPQPKVKLTFSSIDSPSKA